MKRFKAIYFFIAIWCGVTFTPFAHSVELLPSNLTNLSSQTGMVLLKENLNLTAVKLLSHFVTQRTLTYCGVASSVMVLNSTNLTPPLDSEHPPYDYFTQDNFFNNKVTEIITPEEVKNKGMTLAQLSKALQTYGVKADPIYANDINLEIFRAKLKAAILNQHFIIANFLRTGLQQQGGGHHSPVVAYDEKTDQFLILDVARYKYPAYWVKASDLWKAVNTRDGDVYRGFVVIG